MAHNKVAELLAKDPLVSGAFNDAEKEVLKTISSQVGSEGLTKILSVMGALSTTGAGMGAPLLLGAFVHTPKVGEVFARSLIGPSGNLNKAVLPAFSQYMRGYMATQGDN